MELFNGSKICHISDLNDTNYTYMCTEHVLNGTSCIKVTSSEMNCSSGNYIL